MSTELVKATENKTDCRHCGGPLLEENKICPHCARVQVFPNVLGAEKHSEVEALEKRYEASLDDADKRNCLEQIKRFEANCMETVAVLNLNILKLSPTANFEFHSYYELERTKNRGMPSSDPWMSRRLHAEVEIVGERVTEPLFYAALSLDGSGLTRYGDCSLTFKDEMISHRATCFEGNSAELYDQHKAFEKGWKSTWGERHKLCLAKLVNQISSSTQDEDAQDILLVNAPVESRNEVSDEFIEVHIFGSITLRTVNRVILGTTDGIPQSLILALKEKMEQEDIEVVE